MLGLSSATTLQQVRLTLRCWLDPDPVIHGRSDSLCAAEVALRGLDRDMAEEKLNLFQFASGRPT